MMNIIVASSRRRHGISQWILVLLAASFCLVAVSARAEMLEWRYDGTYYPDNPGAWQDSWTTIVAGPTNSITPNSPVAGVALFDDSDTGGGETITVKKNEFDAAFAAAPTLFEWEYEFKMTVNSMGGGKTNNYGLQQEAGVGNQKMIMFAHDPSGNLYYLTSSFIRMGDYIYQVGTENPSLIDGTSHTYKVVKDVVDETTLDIDVNFYLDGNLIDTRNYSSFGSRNETHGFCLASSASAGTANWEVDEVRFSMIPEPSTVVLLAGVLFVPLLLRRKKVL